MAPGGAYVPKGSGNFFAPGFTPNKKILKILQIAIDNKSVITYISGIETTNRGYFNGKENHH